MSLVEDRAKEINYGGALVIVRYSLCVGTDENGEEIWETVPKNTNFFVDGTKTKRKGNIVTLKAYDPASLLDIELPKDQIPYGSLYEQAKWIWEYAATHIAPTNSDSNTSVCIPHGFMSEEDFNALPNTDVSADFSNGQIVSCRDALMWVAQLTCSYVMFKANENNDENILTFKRHRYDGNMKNEREITAPERQNIEFTDTRTYCTYLLAYSGDEQKIYTEKVDYNESWDPQYINPGCVSLPKNPLVARLTTEEQDQINKAIQHYTTHPIRYIKMTGNVDFALELLDVVAFTGGTIDIRKKIIAPVTEIRWKYRGIGTIICNQIPEYSDKSGEETETLHSSPAKMTARNSSQNSAAYSPVISQRDKELAALGKDARTIPDRIITTQIGHGAYSISALTVENFYTETTSGTVSGLSGYMRGGTKPYFMLGMDYNSSLSLVCMYSNNDWATLEIAPGRLRYRSYQARTDGEDYNIELDLLNGGSGGVEKEYVDAQDESYFEKSKKYTDNAVNTVADSVTQLGNSLTTTNNKVQTNTTDIAELRGDLNELQSEYAYTTGIAFKSGGFALTFADKNGETFVNEFEVTETNGKITKIANKTAGKEITVTYE